MAGMQNDAAALSLSALGHEARLAVFRLLVRAGQDGLKVGELGALLDLPASTLAHHLTALVKAGLVQQERRGREVVNRADYTHMTALLAFLTDECCCGVCLQPESEAAA